MPGIWRDREAEEAAYAAGPAYSFLALHRAELWKVIQHTGASFLIPSMPRTHRMSWLMNKVVADQPPDAPPAIDAHTLTDDLRREAERIGLSGIGFAAYDPKYTFAEYSSVKPENVARDAQTFGSSMSVKGASMDEGSVIVCIFEQEWKGTQTIPSAQAERAAVRAYEGVVGRAAKLAFFLHERGFRADVHGPAGMAVSIHYAVEAGLGQLGLNGQLLTPQAGSRCRITLITTNATLVHGNPVDYGIHAICDECQLCVRRCPSGAIPKTREYHRGVMKAKIKPERCAPIHAQAHACGICMKVCPVQRYGLDAVKSHYLETGEILGKGSDELEGYRFIDGKYYGPGQKPRITEDVLHPFGFQIDVTQKAPRT